MNPRLTRPALFFCCHRVLFAVACVSSVWQSGNPYAQHNNASTHSSLLLNQDYAQHRKIKSTSKQKHTEPATPLFDARFKVHVPHTLHSTTAALRSRKTHLDWTWGLCCYNNMRAFTIDAYDFAQLKPLSSHAVNTNMLTPATSTISPIPTESK